ncbi:hypothetical protein HZS_1762 [Henneguya salminicola]|nr:hypothetical protein HZS_1762 [Henneguya salminicola]
MKVKMKLMNQQLDNKKYECSFNASRQIFDIMDECDPNEEPSSQIRRAIEKDTTRNPIYSRQVYKKKYLSNKF